MASPRELPTEPLDVLVVEAEDALRERLAASLRADGLGVVETADLAAGLDLHRRARAHVTVLGRGAEGTRPAEACTRLRSLPGGRHAAVVLLLRPDDLGELTRAGGPESTDFLPAAVAAELGPERIRVAWAAARARRELERCRGHLELARRAGQLGTWELVPASGALTCSREAAQLLGLGLPAVDLRIAELADRLAPADSAALLEWVELAAAGPAAEPLELDFPEPDGGVRRLRLEASPRGEPSEGTLVGVVREVEPARASVTDAERGARPDEGASLLEELERALRACDARRNHVAVLCLDLHQLRSLASALSHPSAERLVGMLHTRLRDGLCGGDLAARLGCDPAAMRLGQVQGDEYAIVVPDLRQASDALQAARRVLELMAEPFGVDGREVFATVSVGIATWPTDARRTEELVERARTAAYCARQQGRNTVLYYSPAMNARAFERLTLETGLRHALERDELVVYYQPRVEVASGRPIGMEALVRWRHPELGLVPPGQFIPLAEETGLIVPMGTWILREACGQARRWQEAGLPPLRMSVNISAVQFRQPDLFEVVTAAARDADLEPRWLELELTESLLMQNPESVVVLLKRFSDQGIHLSIDDFGTGYSSLSYLRRFPIDSLKIDRSFIRELTTNADDAAIATSILLMGKSLKLNVVAEGVETRSQLSFLRVMQCHEAQGYLFSPPLPAAEVEALLRSADSLLGEAA